jgi:hypothetical protein
LEGTGCLKDKGSLNLGRCCRHFFYILIYAVGALIDIDHAGDRYVWSLEDNEWQATLVILRLNRAATSVEWGPQGT